MIPKNTIIEKRIPKQRFYDQVKLKTKVKEQFTKGIDTITLANKFSKETLNIPKTKDVEEIFIFEITLKDPKYLDKIEDTLTVIDQTIPYPILYRFRQDNAVTYKIAYKKRNQNDPNKSVIDTYLTRTIPEKELEEFDNEFDKVFNALNMKILYENIITLFLTNKKSPVEDAIQEEKNQTNLKKELQTLEKKIKKEKQPDKQYDIHIKIKNLKKKIQE